MVFKIIMTVLMLILIALLVLITIIVISVLRYARRQALMKKGIRRIMEVKGISLYKIGSFKELRSMLQDLTEIEMDEGSEDDFKKEINSMTKPKSIKDIIKRKE